MTPISLIVCRLCL